MQSARFSVFAITLSVGIMLAGCSGSPNDNSDTAPGAINLGGAAGSRVGAAGAGAGAAQLPSGGTGGQPGGGLILDVPYDDMAGAANIGAGGAADPYPDTLPDGFTAANMFGGYRVGDEIATQDGSADVPQNMDGCGTTILAVIRDFKADGQNFEGPNIGDDKGLVAPELGPDRKPVFVPTAPTWSVKDPAQMNNWYRTVDGLNKAYKLEMWFAPNSGVSSFQSTSFFPLDGKGWDVVTNGHNYFFTTEIHTRFKYQGGESFKFTGDDDVWVFINGKLAIDLGGVHTARDASIDIDARATELGLVKGNVYDFDMFQAERHTYDSNFRADTNLNFVDCGTIVPEIPIK